MKKDKVLVAMSGGIDSTLAAILLKEQGYELEGLTFRAWDKSCGKMGAEELTNNVVEEAESVANMLGIKHNVLDIRNYFENTIIKNFVSEYSAGRTPNPCVLCNYDIKWGQIIKKANELDCKYIATGHYAKLVEKSGNLFIKKGKDTAKDQSYFLWMLTQEKLRRTLFPLGGYSKDEVRKMAFEKGFEKISKKQESQEICFIPDNDYRGFLKEHIPNFEQKFAEGNFVDSSGKILGKHNGYPNYTIGQRKGLGVAMGHPVYVIKIDASTNTITLGSRNELNSSVFYIENANLMGVDVEKGAGLITKIRYRNSGLPAFLSNDQGRIKVEYYDKVDAITPGQSAVFYKDDCVVGGGVISEVVK